MPIFEFLTRFIGHSAARSGKPTVTSSALTVPPGRNHLELWLLLNANYETTYGLKDTPSLMT